MPFGVTGCQRFWHKQLVPPSQLYFPARSCEAAVIRDFTPDLLLWDLGSAATPSAHMAAVGWGEGEVGSKQSCHLAPSGRGSCLQCPAQLQPWVRARAVTRARTHRSCRKPSPPRTNSNKRSSQQLRQQSTAHIHALQLLLQDSWSLALGAGSGAAEAAAAPCARPGLVDPREIQPGPLTQGRCSHWDPGLSGLTCGGNLDDQGVLRWSGGSWDDQG